MVAFWSPSSYIVEQIQELSDPNITEEDRCGILSWALSTYTSYAEIRQSRHSLYPALFFASSIIEHVSEMAFPAVLAIVHSSHEDTSTTLEKYVNISDATTIQKKTLTSAVGHSLLKRSILPSPSTL